MEHDLVAEPTLKGLLGVLEGTEMVYIHDMDGEIVAMVIARGGWWQEQLPEAPLEHFGHAHIRIDGRVP